MAPAARWRYAGRVTPGTPPIARRRDRGAALLTLLLVIALFGGGWAALRRNGGAARAAPPAAPPALVGVNLAGGEFGPEGQYLGVYDKDYAYPDAAVGAPFLALGMNTARVPIRWERVQPRPLAPLDAIEMGRIDATIAGLSGYAAVILDIHNYAAYFGRRLGDDARSRAMLADLWARLALRYRGNPHLAFGLMNEPVDLPAPAWRRIAEASVAAIRGAGARNLILVPGSDWTGAHSWSERVLLGPGAGPSNADAFAGFADPGDNFAFDLHQYFDENSSGASPSCITPVRAVARLTDATAWLRAQRARGFIGEFGTGPDADCLATLDAVLGFVDANSDVWMGWTVWAGGGWWGNYAFSVQPEGTRQRPQMTVLRRHIAAAASRHGTAGAP